MSDFSETLKQFAKATAGTVLPLETIQNVQHSLGDSRKARRIRAAKRKNPSHSATGRLVFAATVDQPKPRPLPFMKVELWDRDPLGPDDFLGSGLSDAQGRFEITYDPADAGRFDKPDLDLRIIDEYAGRENLLAVIEGPDDVEEQVFDFGNVPVVYYEYHPDIPLPHLYTLEFGKQEFDAMPQEYAVGRKLALAKVARATMGIRLSHYTYDREVELSQIQADYRGKTPYKPPVTLGSDASADEHFVDKLLNGACPTEFTRGPEGLLHVIRTWDSYEHDGTHELPNVHAVFREHEQTLVPVEITIQGRIDNAKQANAPLAEAQTCRPGDTGWERAKHVFECVNYMYTQVSNHLARGHFNAEQYALATFRNFRRNPLRELLVPHLKEVMIINVEGERAIFGPDGLITKNGALTENSLVEAICDSASGIDWYGWSPRVPIGPGHRYAHVANLMWEALTEHVDKFFSANLQGILDHWNEVRGFSEDLVAHSVPYRPADLAEGHQPADPREVADPQAPRVEVGGKLRVVSPLVRAPAADADAAPSEEELKNLAQVCRYAIFHATFFHSWVNDTSDALEASYSQYNPVDRSTPRELTNHISLNLTLSQTRYGMIMRNEDGDIPDSLLEALRTRAEAFANLQYDVRKIRARINI